MSQTTIVGKFQVEGSYIDPDSIVLSDQAETYGVRRTDTMAVVAPANTVVTKVDTGIYTYTFTDPENNLTYDYSFKIVYNDITSYYSGTVDGGEDSDDAELNNYVLTTEAEDYLLANKLKIRAWTSSTSRDKIAALTRATKIINRLPLLGTKTDENQVNAFPRGGDTEVPQEIKDASVEIAYSLLDGMDQENEFENLTILSKRYGSVSITSRDKVSKPYIAMGILNYEAYILLLPYLRDFSTIELERV